MSTSTPVFGITNGPSADRVIDAFKYAFDKENRVICEFELEFVNIQTFTGTHKTRATGQIIGLE